MTQAECGELKITPRYAEMKQRNEYINKRLHVCISVFIYLSITMLSMSVRNDGIVTPLHFDGTNLADLGGGGCDGVRRYDGRSGRREYRGCGSGRGSSEAILAMYAVIAAVEAIVAAATTMMMFVLVLMVPLVVVMLSRTNGDALQQKHSKFL